jgi:DNA-binding LacI/PurR family transcriptional regulator
LRALIKEKRVDAIYCSSDNMAAMTYKVVKDMGMRIPNDIVILGFGMGSTLMTPTLASVKISSNVLGKAAIQLLQNKQAHNFPPLQINLPITIYEGESVQNVKIDRTHNI